MITSNEMYVVDDDAETLVGLADRSGLDGARLLARQSDPGLIAQEARLTREAIDRQLFGAPFYFYREEPFLGAAPSRSA